MKTIERAILESDIARFGLQVQPGEIARQSSMFGEPEPDDEPEACDHVGTGRREQARLFDGHDVVCTHCGAIVETLDTPAGSAS